MSAGGLMVRGVCDDLGPFLAWPGWNLAEAEIRRAIESLMATASESPCVKSKRGAVIIDRFGPRRFVHNAPAGGRPCGGDEACRAACSRTCNHAEERAILERREGQGGHLLHLKVQDGRAVRSGPPSCVTCSRLAVEAKIASVWLWRERWTGYTAAEFHEATLASLGLPDPHAHFPALRARLRVVELPPGRRFGIRFAAKIEGHEVACSRHREDVLERAVERLDAAGVTPELSVWDVVERLKRVKGGAPVAAPPSPTPGRLGGAVCNHRHDEGRLGAAAEADDELRRRRQDSVRLGLQTGTVADGDRPIPVDDLGVGQGAEGREDERRAPPVLVEGGVGGGDELRAQVLGVGVDGGGVAGLHPEQRRGDDDPELRVEVEGTPALDDDPDSHPHVFMLKAMAHGHLERTIGRREVRLDAQRRQTLRDLARVDTETVVEVEREAIVRGEGVEAGGVATQDVSACHARTTTRSSDGFMANESSILTSPPREVGAQAAVADSVTMQQLHPDIHRHPDVQHLRRRIAASAARRDFAALDLAALTDVDRVNAADAIRRELRLTGDEVALCHTARLLPRLHVERRDDLDEYVLESARRAAEDTVAALGDDAPPRWHGRLPIKRMELLARAMRRPLLARELLTFEAEFHRHYNALAPTRREGNER